MCSSYEMSFYDILSVNVAECEIIIKSSIFSNTRDNVSKLFNYFKLRGFLINLIIF